MTYGIELGLVVIVLQLLWVGSLLDTIGDHLKGIERNTTKETWLPQHERLP